KRPSESECRVLGKTVRSGAIGQTDLARATGLAQQSISRIVKSLIQVGAATETKRVRSGKRGQPSVVIRVNPTFAYTIGVSLMTDALAVAVMDFSGQVVDEAYECMPNMQREHVLRISKQIIDDMVSTHNIERTRLLGAGVCLSGRHIGPGAVYNTPELLDDWALVAVDTIFEDHLGLPVWVENDGNAAAVGESLVGVGRSYDHFAYLYIDTLLGGGVILNHELMRGVHGNGGELGMLLPKEHYQHPSLHSLLETLAQNGTAHDSVSTMIRNFDEHWPGIEDWISETCSGLSLIASSLAAILDPEAIVIGGRMPKSLAKRVIPHVSLFNDPRRGKPRPLPQLLVAQASGNASAIGAAALPFKDQFFAAAT
ncbi:MAG: ROK family transcriptional regulator, partial [Pseudomonadota bacterium]